MKKDAIDQESDAVLGANMSNSILAMRPQTTPEKGSGFRPNT